MQEHSTTSPRLCACGCGFPARKGCHYFHSHNASTPRSKPCLCGCGQFAMPGSKYIVGHNARKEIKPEVFWSQVNRSNGPTACWPWKGGTRTIGYVCTKRNRKAIGVHRLAYQLTYGAIPIGIFVCHHCDNMRCCNPSHLFLGTHKDNMDDMKSKGRQASGNRSWQRLHPEWLIRGENHPQAKLSEGQVRSIRQQYAQHNCSQRSLAKQYGVDQSVIGDIVTGHTWRHLL